MRTVEEIKEKWEAKRAQWKDAQPQHTLDEAMEWLGDYGEIWKLLDHIAELEAQNAALQARVEAAGEWQGVEVVPTEDIERCLLLNRQYGGERAYDTRLFGSYSVANGFHWFSQYGDGSEYPEALDNRGEWYWCLMPPPPSTTPAPPSATIADARGWGMG